MADIGPLGRPFPPVYDAVDRYSWKDDAEFQHGLESILTSDVTPEQAEELTLKAQCFYFERKFDVPIDFEEYKAWREYKANKAAAKSAPPKAAERSSSSFANVPAADETPASATAASEPANAEAAGPQYPPSFAELVELISAGKTIPGIKHIPGTVLEGQSSESTQPKRRKPWEKDDVSATEPASTPLAT